MQEFFLRPVCAILLFASLLCHLTTSQGVTSLGVASGTRNYRWFSWNKVNSTSLYLRNSDLTPVMEKFLWIHKRVIDNDCVIYPSLPYSGLGWWSNTTTTYMEGVAFQTNLARLSVVLWSVFPSESLLQAS